jgi:hypothetical protein
MTKDAKDTAMAARLSFYESKFFHGKCKIQKKWRASKVRTNSLHQTMNGYRQEFHLRCFKNVTNNVFETDINFIKRASSFSARHPFHITQQSSYPLLKIYR